MYGIATLTMVVSSVCIRVAAMTQIVMTVRFEAFDASAVDGTVIA